MIFKLYFPLLSPRTVNTMTYSYDISTGLSQFIMPKDTGKSGRRFQVNSILLRFILCQLNVQISGWTESYKQLLGQYLKMG